MALSDLGTVYQDLDDLINKVNLIEAFSGQASNTEVGVTANSAHNLTLGDKVTLIGFTDQDGNATPRSITGFFDVVNINGGSNPDSLYNAFNIEVSAADGVQTGNVTTTVPTAQTRSNGQVLEPGFIAETAVNRFVAAAASDIDTSTTTVINVAAGQGDVLDLATGDYFRLLGSNDDDGIYKVASRTSDAITIDGTPTAAEIADGVASAFAGTLGNKGLGSTIFKVEYTPTATIPFKSRPSGNFFTSHINVDAINKKFRFIATPGNALDDDGAGGARTDFLVNDGTFYRAGSGIQGQALYSFFKYAWKEVGRLPQFAFPMLSITNEQFEFQNGWYFEDTTLNQRLQLDNLELTITDDAGGDILSIPTTQGEDLRQFEASDSIRVLFDPTNASNIVAKTGIDPEKLSLTATETTLNTGLKSGASLSANIGVISTDLIRTAGFSIPSTDNSYTKLFYSGVITLGTFIDTVDRLYYIQENTATATTTDVKYTGPTNVGVPILKLANAGPGGNNASDIDFVAGVINITNGTGYTFTSVANTIDSVSTGEFSGISVGDIIEISAAVDTGNNRKFTVTAANADQLTVAEDVTDETADTTAVMVVLPQIYAPSFTGTDPTDLTIFNAGDLIGVSGTTNNTTFGLQRVGNQEFSGSANAAALGSAPAGVRLAFDSTVSITDEANVGAIVGNDVRSTFKLFLRERAKSYAESSLADIGVDTLTNIVYRFPVTNITDVKITSTSDTQIDQTDVNNAGADQTFNTDDLNKVQIYYLRNPQTGADNLTLSGDYAQNAVYSAGDVARDGNTLSDRYYYVSNERDGADGAADIASVNAGQTRNIYTETGTTIQFNYTANPQTIVISGVDFTGAGNLQAGDRFSISGETSVAGSTSGSNFLVQSATFSTDTTITLATSGSPISGLGAQDGAFGDSLKNINAGANYTGKSTGDATEIQTREHWTLWSKKPVSETTRGGYTTTDPAVNGGEREIKNPTSEYFAFDVIIDADDTDNSLISTPYVKATGGLRTNGVYEFVQWGLRRTGYINESASANLQDPYKKNGEIADLLIDFVGDTLTTRQGVFIDDISDQDQNALSFLDFFNNTKTYPLVVSCKLVFNANLASDTDAVFYLYYTNLANDQGSGLATTDFDFGNVNAKQVYQANGELVGSTIENKCNSGTLEGDGTSRSFSFTYAYSEDNADPDNANPKQSPDGAGIKPTGTELDNEVGGDTDVTAVAIGLGTGAYVVAAGQITETGLTINLVAPLERNYINP